MPVTLGSLTFDNLNSYTIAGAEPNGSLTMDATGTAAITVVKGTHILNVPVTFARDTGINVAAGATLKITDPVTINPGVSVTKTGSGTLLFKVNFQLPGGAVSADAGMLEIGPQAIVTPATLTASGSAGLAGSGTIKDASIVYSSDVYSDFAGSIVGTSRLTMDAGTLTLSGNSTFTGGAIVTGGVLDVGIGATLAPTTLAVSGNGQLIGWGTIKDAAVSYTSSADGTFQGTFSGTSSLTLDAPGRTLTLTGNSTHTGGTIVNAGTLEIAPAGTIAPTTLAVRGNARLGGTGTIQDTAVSFTSSADVIFAGHLSGASSLRMDAPAGNLVLSADNTFLGGAIVNAGTLEIADQTTFAPTTLTISGSGQLGGDGTIKDAAVRYLNSVESGFRGNIVGTGRLTVDAPGSTLTLIGDNTYTGGTIVAAGTLEIGDAHALPWRGDLTIGAGGRVVLSEGLSVTAGSGGVAVVTATASVPEPATLLLLVAGAAFGFLAPMRRATRRRL
jgi:fibronectin-binding autotransporter adhesin